jgi:thioredoxin reductase
LAAQDVQAVLMTKVVVRSEVAIVGAGPYGLSLAAHLQARGVGFRIFGVPMGSWRTGMPRGMHLKSDGFASNLYDPLSRFTLEQFCAGRGIAYHPTHSPVRLDTFVAYGLAFQASCVPSLEEKLVTALVRSEEGFKLTLEDRTTLEARRVVIATGISYLEYIPPELLQLGSKLCSHSSAHHDLSGFAGRSVIVVGAGASAADVAVLLHAAGASVELIARHRVECHRPPPPGRRPLWQRIRRPHLGLGPSLRSTLYTLFPGLFRGLPGKLRMRIVRRHLGPAAGWFLKDALTSGALPVHEGFAITEAHADGAKAFLRFQRADGATLERRVDHVIAATGYRVSLQRLPFLDRALREAVEVIEGYPVLSAHFESSVPGLHFVGLPAAGSFGPLMRFALGARCAAQRLAAHLTRVTATRGTTPAAQASTR